MEINKIGSLYPNAYLNEDQVDLKIHVKDKTVKTTEIKVKQG